MSKRKSSEDKEIEVRTGIYITFFNKICLYVRIINSKIPKIYMKGLKKSQKNSGQIGIVKKRRDIDIEEANELMSGNINMCRL